MRFYTFIRLYVFMRLQIEDDGERKKYSVITEKIQKIFLKILEKAKTTRINIYLTPYIIVGWHSSCDISP